MMYCELLSRAMEKPEAANPPSGLLESFVESRQRRAELDQAPDASTDRLACEVAYDLALIRISSAMAIDTSPANFSVPMRERDRLEHKLAGLGLNWCRFVYPNGMPTQHAVTAGRTAIAFN